MNNIIMIKNLCANALSIDDGEKIKKEIESILKNSEKVILDFNGISLFATPFFNACIGYYVVEFSPKGFEKKIECINLSDLGKETLKFSYDNAVIVYNRNLSSEDQQKINDIIENNIKNS